jgi:hypothetical protein
VKKKGYCEEGLLISNAVEYSETKEQTLLVNLESCHIMTFTV